MSENISERIKPLLTDERLERIKRVQRDMADLLPMFDKLEACGRDCQERRQAARGLQQAAIEAQRQFYPDRS